MGGADGAAVLRRAYVAHLKRAHPDRTIPTYEEFFRERQTARYNGTGGRCC